MGKFNDFIVERDDTIKNWKDIVDKFDVIEDAILQPNGKSIRVRGKKNGKFADVYTDYKNSAVAKEVLNKVEAFIGIKESELDEAKLSKSEYKDKKGELINLLWKYDNGEGFDKKEDIYKQYKMEIDTIMLGKVKLERALELLGFNSKEIDKNDKSVKAIKDFLSDNLNESAVGKPGRTSIADAEEHIDDELVAEFKKIIKKLGGKTVAKVLLDKLGSKPEIKDEIEHIEDMIDNSNY